MRVQVNGSFSGWIDVLSGVPQGSVLRPLLFLIFVHDLPEWVKNSMMMFADDKKIWARIQKLEDKDLLHYDLDKLVEWSKQWFNPEKCKVMHIGHDLPGKYTMNTENKGIQL